MNCFVFEGEVARVQWKKLKQKITYGKREEIHVVACSLEHAKQRMRNRTYDHLVSTTEREQGNTPAAIWEVVVHARLNLIQQYEPRPEVQNVVFIREDGALSHDWVCEMCSWVCEMC